MRWLVGNQKCVISVLLTILIVLGMSGAGYADMTPVSDRTPQVRDAIVAAVPGVNTAADVTKGHLTAITGLNLRSKGITALKAGDFEGLPSLRSLTLQNNDLTSLPAGVFNGLSDLTDLYLQNNDLTSLPRRVFNDLSDLRSLYLHENDLTSLPAGVFNDLSNLRTLYLNSNDLTSLPVGLFNGLSLLTTLHLHENDLTSLPVGVFNGLSNLRTLLLSSNDLTSLPVGLFNGLSSLTTLELSSNDLTSLPAGVFNGLSDLVTLLLYNNDLTSFPAGLFNGLSRLTGLYVFNNKVNPLPLMVSLEKVADGEFKAVALAGAPSAIILPVGVVNGSISGGATTVTIPAGSVESETFTVTRTAGTIAAVTVDIGTLPSLPQGHYGYAVVRSADLPLEVSAGSFLNSRTLAVRDAIVAALPGVNSVGDVTEAHLSTIRFLDLSNRGISTLKSGDFEGLSALRTLYFDNNNLTSLPADVFNGLRSLTRLSFNNNALTTLPSDVFNGLRSLQWLSLYDNALTSLPSDVFNGLASLKVIYLFNNDLTTLPNDVFNGLASLEVLYISANDLTSLPSDVFNGLASLNSLALSNNDLTGLPEGVFNGLSSLTRLYLSGNEVNPLPLTVFLEKVADGGLKAVAPVGAPFEMVLPLTLTNGNITGDATTVTIPTGSMESETLTVTRTPDTTGAITVDIGSLPSLPQNHGGYMLSKSADLPLEVSAESFLNSRTLAVRDAIVAALPGVDSVDDVTEAHLAAITTLELQEKGITALKAGDFEGLSALMTLYLYDNDLSALPAGIFDGLSSLTRLNLRDNNLTSLPAGIFDGLSALTALSLHRNDLSVLPAGIFDGLSALLTLSLFDNDLSVLPENVFNGLSALTDLSLYGNDLSALPAGIFDDLSALTLLDLNSNEVNPLSLTVSLEKVADGEFKAVAPAGAPFAIILPISVVDGSISGGATTLTIPTGAVESASLTVTRTTGTIGAVTVDIGDPLPELPANQRGYTLVKSAELPLTIIDALSNSTPVFADGTTVGRSIAENTAADVNIGAAITATDTDNDILTYTLSGTDADAFHIDDTTGQLKTKSALDYETKQAYTVEVTASDGTLTATITVTIDVTDVEEVILTARFEALPASHDGSAFIFELHFSTDITISYINVRDDVLDVTGGEVTKARRLEQGSNLGWEITIAPTSNAEVSITLRPTTDCEAASAVCTADGRLLSNEVSEVVPGPNAPAAPRNLRRTPTLSVSTPEPLTEATLHEGIVTLTLNGSTYERSSFMIRNAVSVSGITGIALDTFKTERISDTKVAVNLVFDGNIRTNSTLTLTLGSGAIADYDGYARTAQIPVTAVPESIVASTAAALTEATLDDSVVRLTLSGRKFEASNAKIRSAVSVSGITGVTVGSPNIHRRSDTEVTVALDFNGNLNADGTLTLTVGADAIAGYNCSALTTEVTVTADRENALLSNYPNPFNPETWMPYQLAAPADVTLTIYAVDGRLVRRLVLGHQPAGLYRSRSRAAYWDGKNASGESVASGVYFYRLIAGDFTATRKMLIRK